MFIKLIISLKWNHDSVNTYAQKFCTKINLLCQYYIQLYHTKNCIQNYMYMYQLEVLMYVYVEVMLILK